MQKYFTLKYEQFLSVFIISCCFITTSVTDTLSRIKLQEIFKVLPDVNLPITKRTVQSVLNSTLQWRQTYRDNSNC